MSRLPQPVTIAGCLLTGLGLGLAFPTNQVVLAVAQSGTWFPRTIVTLATAIVYILMSAALARTLLSHARGTRFLAILITLYVVMGAVSLLYVSAWIPVLTDLPFSRPDVPLPGFFQWLQGVGRTFSGTLTGQPLLQMLVAATLTGALAGSVRAFRPAAHGLIVAGDWILRGFAKLLWYYPIMIGCLAILIPARFGVRGLEVYGRTSLNLAIVAIVWSAAMLLLVRATTRRTWPQIWKYFAAVYVTGFGTGGSYDTLPVNLISAERDLGLRPQVARASIVLGTVLNKNVATMGVMLVTVSTCGLLGIPITMTEIAVLIPPVMILGLESPGIPGGAGVFMSPVIASVLAVPDPATFVTTFVTFYTGLIPMLATAGNTTDDGFVGAIVNDYFADDEDERAAGHGEASGEPMLVPYSTPTRLAGIVLSVAGLWMVVAPQARMGLPALRWMSSSVFPGEAVAGAIVLLGGLWMSCGARDALDSRSAAEGDRSRGLRSARGVPPA
jgi:Na+/H+-dicarboxylate symporter